MVSILMSTPINSIMNTDIDYDEYLDDDIIFYSVLYSIVTVLFAMAVLSKFLTNEFRFGFRSVLSLAVLFLGEPLCQFFIKGPGGVFAFAMCCLVIYSILPASHLPVGNKAVLITGMIILCFLGILLSFYLSSVQSWHEYWLNCVIFWQLELNSNFNYSLVWEIIFSLSPVWQVQSNYDLLKFLVTCENFGSIICNVHLYSASHK